eukprot:tig00000829_g4668.t1
MAFVAALPIVPSKAFIAGKAEVAKAPVAANKGGVRMSKKATFTAAATAAALLAASPVFAADGAAIFTNNCAACHAGGNNVIAAEKTLKKAALEQYLDGGYNVDAIKKQVTGGKNAMPAFGGRLAEDEIAAVAEYVYSQAGNGW